jgi:hypothetical protein
MLFLGVLGVVEGKTEVSKPVGELAAGSNEADVRLAYDLLEAPLLRDRPAGQGRDRTEFA